MHMLQNVQLCISSVCDGAGMSDQRIAGEMMLGSLIEAAKDAMTEINQPEGHCIFCLDPLVPPGTVPSQDLLLRLSCYHCYHL